MSEVTIHNKGKRLIQCAEGDLNVDSYLKMPREKAEKLVSLFRGELTIIEDIQKEADKKAKKATKKEADKKAD